MNLLQTKRKNLLNEIMLLKKLKAPACYETITHQSNESPAAGCGE